MLATNSLLVGTTEWLCFYEGAPPFSSKQLVPDLLRGEERNDFDLAAFRVSDYISKREICQSFENQNEFSTPPPPLLPPPIPGCLFSQSAILLYFVEKVFIRIRKEVIKTRFPNTFPTLKMPKALLRVKRTSRHFLFK